MDTQFRSLDRPVPVEVLRHEVTAATGSELTRCLEHYRPSLLLGLDEMPHSHFIEKLRCNRFSRPVIDNIDAGLHTTINSAFFFSSSSKKSFSPRLNRASTS